MKRMLLYIKTYARWLKIRKIIMFSVLFFLLIPLVLHIMDGPAPGSENYYDLRVSNLYVEGARYDALTSREINFNPYFFVLGNLSKMMDDLMLLKLFPVVAALISSIFLFMILKRVEENKYLFVMSVFILSPLFVKSLYISSSNYFSLMLMLPAVYILFFKENLRLISYLLFLLLAFSPFINTLIIFLVFVYYLYSQKKEKAKISEFFVFSAILLVAVLYNLYVFLTTEYLAVVPYLSYSFISDLGSFLGFSIFAFMLALYYLFLNFDKYKILSIYLLLLLVFSFFLGNRINVFTNILVSFFAGLGLYRIIKLKWKHKNIKYLTLIAIFCGLLLSYVSMLDMLDSRDPSQDIIGALEWLKQNSEKDSLVISSADNGFWIEYFSERKPVIDQYYSSYYFTKINKSSEFFQTRILDNAKIYIEELDIGYILIDDKMRSDIWKKKDQGLLFLLRNKETFRKVYHNETVELWKVMRK